MEPLFIVRCECTKSSSVIVLWWIHYSKRSNDQNVKEKRLDLVYKWPSMRWASSNKTRKQRTIWNKMNTKDHFCSNFGCDEIADQIHNMYIRPGPRHFDEIGGLFISRRRDIRSFLMYSIWHGGGDSKNWRDSRLTR